MTVFLIVLCAATLAAGFLLAVAGGMAGGDNGERTRKRGLLLMTLGACGFAAVLVFGLR